MYEIKFTSHKRYLFRRLFSIKKGRLVQTKVHFDFSYSVRIEMTQKPSKIAAAKMFSPVCML